VLYGSRNRGKGNSSLSTVGYSTNGRGIRKTAQWGIHEKTIMGTPSKKSYVPDILLDF